MARIGVLGSGNFGANVAFFVAEKGVSDVFLYDVQDGLATGKSLDMMEAAPIRGYRTWIGAAQRIEEIKDADIVIIAAGAVREPGMKREDLFERNLPIIKDLAGRLSGSKAKVIMATEPVDLLTTAFTVDSGLKATTVLGLGGFLDATRMRYLIAEALNVAMEDVVAQVIGRHADDMIPLPSHSSVSGVPITALLTPEQITKIVDQVKKAGNLIVELTQRSNAYYGPSAAAADLAEAIIKNTGRIVSVSTMLSGQLGVRDVAMSLPAVVGKNGIEQLLEPALSANDRAAFVASGERMRAILTKSGY